MVGSRCRRLRRAGEARNPTRGACFDPGGIVETPWTPGAYTGKSRGSARRFLPNSPQRVKTGFNLGKGQARQPRISAPGRALLDPGRPRPPGPGRTSKRQSRLRSQFSQFAFEPPPPSARCAQTSRPGRERGTCAEAAAYCGPAAPSPGSAPRWQQRRHLKARPFSSSWATLASAAWGGDSLSQTAGSGAKGMIPALSW